MGQRLGDWMTVDVFAASKNAGRMFNEAAIRYAILEHRTDLIRRGVLLIGTGRRPHLIHRDFGRVVLDLRRQRAMADAAE